MDTKARSAVNRAVNKGILPHISTQACTDCGNQAQDYHHYMGYSEEHWLDVIPLCRKCHAKTKKPRKWRYDTYTASYRSDCY